MPALLAGKETIMVEEITTATIDDVVKGDTPVLVDFWATWCGPCRALSPIIDELSDEIDGIEFYKCNVDENQELAMRFGIMSIPTIMVFKAGEPIFNSVGAAPKGKLKAELEKLTA